MWTFFRSARRTTVLCAVAFALVSVPPTQAASPVFNGNTVSHDLPTYNVLAYGAKGDGVTDDTTAINAAATAGCSKSGVILLPAGYTFLSGQVNLCSGETLQAYGATLKASTGTNYMVSMPASGANISVLGGTFDETNITPNTGNANTDGAIYAASGSTYTNIRIEGVNLINIPTANQNYHGIMLTGVSGGIISKVYIQQSGGDAINVNAGTYTITNSYVAASGDGCIGWNNLAYGTIANNILTNCSLGIGAGAEGSLGTISPIVISNNYIYACDYGMDLGWFSQTGKQGPVNISVTGNTVSNPRTAGIAIFGNSTSPGNVYLSITGNTVDDAGSTAYNGTNGNGDAIVVSYAPNASITGNIINNTRRYGIDNEITSGSSLDSTITGNTLYNTATNGGFASGYGAIKINGTDTVISNNVIDSGGGNGIFIDAGGTAGRHTIIGNTIKGVSAGYGLFISSTITEARVVGNQITGALHGASYPAASTKVALNTISGNTDSNVSGSTFLDPVNVTGNVSIPDGTASSTLLVGNTGTATSGGSFGSSNFTFHNSQWNGSAAVTNNYTFSMNNTTRLNLNYNGTNIFNWLGAGSAMEFPGTGGYSILSNAGNATTAFTFNAENAGHTSGDIMDFQNAGTTLSTINNAGAFISPAGSATSCTGGHQFSNGVMVISGAGAPTCTAAAGSLYLRSDGASGSRLYVSAGGGTWAAVSGV